MDRTRRLARSAAVAGATLFLVAGAAIGANVLRHGPTAGTDPASTGEVDQATETPEPTEPPEATETLEPTETPEAAETPEPTETPEAARTPEPTETPEATDVENDQGEDADEQGETKGGATDKPWTRAAPQRRGQPRAHQ